LAQPPLRKVWAAQVREPQQMRDASPGELGRRGGIRASAPRGGMRTRPSRGLPAAGGSPRAAWLGTTMPSSSGSYLSSAQALWSSRGRPLRQGGYGSRSLLKSCGIQTDATLWRKRDRTFRSASPSRSEACLQQRMPSVRKVCKRGSAQNKHCAGIRPAERPQSSMEGSGNSVLASTALLATRQLTGSPALCAQLRQRAKSF